MDVFFYFWKYWLSRGWTIREVDTPFWHFLWSPPPRQNPVYATDLVTTNIGFDQYKLTDRDATSIFYIN